MFNSWVRLAAFTVPLISFAASAKASTSHQAHSAFPDMVAKVVVWTPEAFSAAMSLCSVDRRGNWEMADCGGKG